jgi:NADH-quinone oxidoreductase subunit D
MSHRTLIPIGPYHPLQEEAEFFQLHVEGEKVVDMDVRISYNHRGIEKLTESKTFDQAIFSVERVCGICSASHPLAYVQAVEAIIGEPVPERALYLRTIVNELERIHSHMLWLGLAGHFIGYNTVFMWAWRYREPVLDLLELVTGSRINYANVKIGGVREDFDLDAEKIALIAKYMDELQPSLEMLTKAVLDDPVLHARLKGVGVLTKENARRYAVVGPTARASGINIDTRRDDPYAAYNRVKFDVITQEAGDVYSKAVVRCLEALESIKIVKQGIRDIPPGPVDAGYREIPEGEACGHVEAPRGETFHYVRSDGTNRPYRHKIRAPSYVNVPSFKASCIGQPIADVCITLAAVDPCYSCTERMAVVVDASSKKKLMDFHDLVHLSQEKTQRLMKRTLGHGFGDGAGHSHFHG